MSDGLPGMWEKVDLSGGWADTAGGAPIISDANPDTEEGAPPPTTREEIVRPVDHTSP